MEAVPVSNSSVRTHHASIHTSLFTYNVLLNLINLSLIHVLHGSLNLLEVSKIQMTAGRQRIYVYFLSPKLFLGTLFYNCASQFFRMASDRDSVLKSNLLCMRRMHSIYRVKKSAQ
jgi:hypothetical protein